MTDIPVLTDIDALQRFATELREEAAIAVDLEADSMHNYQEKVCLLQFSSSRRTVLIDPLAIKDLSPLRPLMADPAVVKIFHAADYDIRCLFRDFRIEVRGLFDTMLACQLLGEPRIGLADVLARYFDVTLDKQLQKADWSRRPLPDGMIRYAAEDTRHLHQLAALLEQSLRDKGRLDWFVEECLLQEKVRHTETPGPLFLRFKGAWKLKPRQLAVLDGLLQWRDQVAHQRDCPLFKVVGNSILFELAAAMPRTRQELGRVTGMVPRLAERHGKVWLQLIDHALALPVHALPVYPARQVAAKDPDAEARLKTLKKWRQDKAAALGMDAGCVINNSLLEAIACRPPRTAADLEEFTEMKRWQQKELGPAILRLFG